MERFNDPKMKEILADPINNKDEIEKLIHTSIRVYGPGDKYPALTNSLMMDFHEGQFLKSGVFRVTEIPSIDRTRLPPHGENRNLGSTMCPQFTGMVKSDYTINVHDELYKGNIFKPAQQFGNLNELKQRGFKLDNIMDVIGDGVYYYFGCRSADPSTLKLDDFNDILKKSALQQAKPKK
jgi:hypothetical protein